MPLRERTRPGLGIIEPCLPSPARVPPAGPGWLHEIKHDGFRILARRDSAGVRLITRAGNDFSSRFPFIAMAVSKLPVRSCLIDGEAIVCEVTRRLRRWSTEDIDAPVVVLLRRRLNFLEMVMGKLALALAIAISILPSTSHAQEREDMTQVTCTNYLIMAPDMARTFSAWMSGWYNQKFGYTTVGLDDYGKRVASLRQWCTDNPQATVMAALDRSAPQTEPPTGQDKVDMALVTCKQYLTSDAERQDMIAYWMSGYVQASMNQPKFYFRQFATDKRTVAKYCKKHGPETVMSAIQSGTNR